ncbi:hypothetical protein [Halegenticoccus tardaugens]|uniref:hypothetical protein n=1 Tax=Halegenticoccus tardaugens TaxID=2071624 RepID=UPI001E351C50|nr:hypothetical protein [Halegenticoccus tardaugens]
MPNVPLARLLPITAGAQILAATDVDEETKTAELEALVERTEQAGSDITVDAVANELEDQHIGVPSYS